MVTVSVTVPESDLAWIWWDTHGTQGIQDILKLHIHDIACLAQALDPGVYSSRQVLNLFRDYVSSLENSPLSRPQSTRGLVPCCSGATSCRAPAHASSLKKAGTSTPA